MVKELKEKEKGGETRQGEGGEKKRGKERRKIQTLVLNHSAVKQERWSSPWAVWHCKLVLGFWHWTHGANCPSPALADSTTATLACFEFLLLILTLNYFILLN